MSGVDAPAWTPSRSNRWTRALGLAALALLGLLAGAVAGLFIADWAGWMPQLFAC